MCNLALRLAGSSAFVCTGPQECGLLFYEKKNKVNSCTKTGSPLSRMGSKIILDYPKQINTSSVQECCGHSNVCVINHNKSAYTTKRKHSPHHLNGNFTFIYLVSKLLMFLPCTAYNYCRREGKTIVALS